MEQCNFLTAFDVAKHPKSTLLLIQKLVLTSESQALIRSSKPSSHPHHGGSTSEFIIVQVSYHLPTLLPPKHGFSSIV